MSTALQIPAISVIHDLDSGEFVLHANSYGQLMPAGERLFRGYPHPAVAFTHADEQAAEKDAAMLRAYLEECASGKRKDKEPPKRGWWED